MARPSGRNALELYPCTSVGTAPTALHKSVLPIPSVQTLGTDGARYRSATRSGDNVLKALEPGATGGNEADAPRWCTSGRAVPLLVCASRARRGVQRRTGGETCADNDNHALTGRDTKHVRWPGAALPADAIAQRRSAERFPRQVISWQT